MGGGVVTHCQGNTSACDGSDLAPVRLGLRRDVFVLCSGCRRTAAAMGVRIVERRIESVPVAVERRGRTRPAWLDRLTARADDSWRLSA